MIRYGWVFGIGFLALLAGLIVYGLGKGWVWP